MLQYYIMKPLFLKNRSLVQSYHHSMDWKHSPLCLETLGISLLFNNSRVSKNGSTPGFLKGLRSDQQQPIFFVKIAPTQEKSNTISGQGFWRPHEWAFMLQNTILCGHISSSTQTLKLGIKRTSLYLIIGDVKAPEGSDSVPVSPMEWQHWGAKPGTQPRCWEALPNARSNLPTEWKDGSWIQKFIRNRVLSQLEGDTVYS